MKVAGATVLAQARVRLAERLRDRRKEIEAALLTRIYGVSDTSGIADPQYAEGLRVAVSTALEYGLTAIEYGDDRPLPIPPVLLIQARTAARIGISLDTVLRRYFAGYSLLADSLIDAAKDELLAEDSLKRVLRAQATLFDRLLATVGEEYAREAEARTASAEARRAERVQRLLDGELLDPSVLGYDLEGHHLGVVAAGPDALDVVRSLDDSLDCRTLIVPRGETTVWAWLGARRGLDAAGLAKAIAAKPPLRSSIAVGEPGEGLRGWRLTHEQARAALAVAVRSSRSFARYRDVALIASMLQDDLLCASLRELYLAPLEKERDGGAGLRETLRAYISAERNASSAACALDVSRRTVANRLRVVEEAIGCPLSAAMPDIEAVLHLKALDGAEPDPK